ncbi:L,D-transpeptidase family protein [Pedobacter sp. AW1-32]|uniref:L,D-transpeptidase family protein n=1 Tax=Pedobacter sp. AW1-32 TaxID=3383026 RepID=UPI003FEED9F7
MKLIVLAFLLFSNFMVNAQNNFTGTQLKFERVESAYREKWPAIQKSLLTQHINGDYEMLVNAYKAEGKLEVWLKDKTAKQFSLFHTYDFCAHSGVLGPKLYEGDKQTPEGFYYINIFNPMSTYYLSLGINYPNAVDVWRTGEKRSPGSDIYIHGNCVTVGCIPLTDDKIKELYLLALFATDAENHKILVNIYPFKMTDANLRKFGSQFPAEQEFWKNLQKVYQAFEKKYLFPKISLEAGAYVLK